MTADTTKILNKLDMFLFFEKYIDQLQKDFTHVAVSQCPALFPSGVCLFCFHFHCSGDRSEKTLM